MLTTRRVNPNEYKQLYSHMRRDFPAGEIPPYFAVCRNLNNGVFTGLYILDDALNEPREVGYAIITALPSAPYALVNHLAIMPEYRSGGYGGRFLQLLFERLAGRTLLLEVESPAHSPNEEARSLRERRVAFYERNGFVVVPTARAKIFGIEMLILSNNPGGIGSVRSVMRELYGVSFKTRRWLRFIDVVDAP